MSHTDEFNDNLFMLPNTEHTYTDEKSVGGSYSDIFAFTKEGLASKIKEDKSFDLQKAPILLVSGVDESILKGSKTSIKAFIEAGVREQDILALNGPLVEFLLKDRTIDNGSVLKNIVMSVEDIKYKDIKDILGEQVAFIIMFNHLYFLATFDNPSFSAKFSDDIGVRFDALMTELQPPIGGQNYKNAKTKLDKPQFGVAKDALTSYWDNLENTYVKSEDTRIKYEDLVGTIIGGPKSVLKYLVSSQVKLQAGIRNDTTEKGYEGLNTEFEIEHKNNDVSNVSSTTETAEGLNETNKDITDLSIERPSAPPVSPQVEVPTKEEEASEAETLGKNKFGQSVYKDSKVDATYLTPRGYPTSSRGIVKSKDSHGRYVIYPYLVSRPNELSKTPIKVVPRKVQIVHSGLRSVTENNENNNTQTVVHNNASDPGQVSPSVKQRKMSRRSRNTIGRRTRKLNRRS